MGCSGGLFDQGIYKKIYKGVGMKYLEDLNSNSIDKTILLPISVFETVNQWTINSPLIAL